MEELRTVLLSINSMAGSRTRAWSSGSVRTFFALRVYLRHCRYILFVMAKRLVEIDDRVLAAARAELGTETIKDTVDQALKLAAGDRLARQREAIEALAKIDFEDRSAAWR